MVIWPEVKYIWGEIHKKKTNKDLYFEYIIRHIINNYH